ncbi:MAG: potassium transporter, partial [Clostridiales bacterium]|nr:potassium transporter [Clostridiales bacterium]
MDVSILRLVIGVVIAFFVGKLVSKVKLPSILGWLIAGMILGPHAVGLLSDSLLNASWYQPLLSVFESAMGLMIGTELIIRKLKKSGKQIVVTTMYQSLTTFFMVTLFFGAIFYFVNVPLYLAFIFGGIALATAPAPALSIVKEFNADGPVTRTLIPMAALDDIVAIVVFFSINSFIIASSAGTSTPLYQTLAMMILLPIVIGIVLGLVGGLILKKETSKCRTLITMIMLILLVSGVGFVFNNFILSEPVINFMLIGMAFS